MIKFNHHAGVHHRPTSGGPSHASRSDASAYAISFGAAAGQHSPTASRRDRYCFPECSGCNNIQCCFTECTRRKLCCAGMFGRCIFQRLLCVSQNVHRVQQPLLHRIHRVRVQRQLPLDLLGQLQRRYDCIGELHLSECVIICGMSSTRLRWSNTFCCTSCRGCKLC